MTDKLTFKKIEAYGAIAFGILIILSTLLIPLLNINFLGFDNNSNLYCYTTIMIIGIIFVIAGFYDYNNLKKEKNTTEPLKYDRYCPNCERSIPFDANICPYCSKNFNKY